MNIIKKVQTKAPNTPSTKKYGTKDQAMKPNTIAYENNELLYIFFIYVLTSKVTGFEKPFRFFEFSVPSGYAYPYTFLTSDDVSSNISKTNSSSCSV